MVRRIQAKGSKHYRQPKYQYDKKWSRDRTARLLNQSPARLHQPLVLRNAGGFEPTVHRIVRLQSTDAELDPSQHGVHDRALDLRAVYRWHLCRVVITRWPRLLGPCRRNRRGCVGAQSFTDRYGVLAPFAKALIELDKIDRKAAEITPDLIVR